MVTVGDGRWEVGDWGGEGGSEGAARPGPAATFIPAKKMGCRMPRNWMMGREGGRGRGGLRKGECGIKKDGRSTFESGVEMR